MKHEVVYYNEPKTNKKYSFVEKIRWFFTNNDEFSNFPA